MKKVVGEQLAPKDAMFVYAEGPRSRQFTVTGGLFAPDVPGAAPPTKDELVDWFRARTVSPLLRRRLRRSFLDLDYPVWVEDLDFELDNHLHLLDPLDWQGFRTLLGRLSEEPIDMSRPLWEVYVAQCVGGFPPDPRDGLAVLLRVHHAAADGIALQSIQRILFGEELVADVGPQFGVAGPAASAPGGVFSVVRSYRGFRDAARSFRSAVAERTVSRATADYPLPPARTPTVLDGPVGPRRGAGAAFFPLADVRAIQDRLDAVTLNDVALTLIGGAMRQYLAAIGHPPAGSLIASVPMTIRPRNADGSLAPDGDGRGNNRFVMMTVDLHSDLEDPAIRAKAVHESVIGERRRLSDPVEVAAEDGAARYVPPGFLVRLLRRRNEDSRGNPKRSIPDDKPFNTTVMTVYPLRSELRILGNSRVCRVGLGPLNGTGLSHLHGVAGECFSVSFLCDTALCSDPDRYAELLEDEFERLRAQVLRASDCAP